MWHTLLAGIATSSSAASIFLPISYMHNLQDLAKKKKIKTLGVSMGQGQEIIARKYMASATVEGQWVLLQNTHLGLGYLTEVTYHHVKLHHNVMSSLQTHCVKQLPLVCFRTCFKSSTCTNCNAFGSRHELGPFPPIAYSNVNGSLGLQVEQYLIKTEDIHEDFRLWITAEPHPNFPIGLLQMGIKITNEAPVGMKAGLRASYQWVSQVSLWILPHAAHCFC